MVTLLLAVVNNFYPRPPRGGRHRRHGLWYTDYAFLSTPSARRATAPTPQPARGRSISIHALREEGDLAFTLDSLDFLRFLSTPSARRATRQGNRRGYDLGISIHALREEGDRFRPRSLSQRGLFLSTPSARRATFDEYERLINKLHFYPRPPRGGRRECIIPGTGAANISIHALREEGDDWTRRTALPSTHFYPRPPRGGRPTRQGLFASTMQFLSTPSARRATVRPPYLRERITFLSTPSARRATISQGNDTTAPEISIHALREEGDLQYVVAWIYPTAFLSTPSARRATYNAFRFI